MDHTLTTAARDLRMRLAAAKLGPFVPAGIVQAMPALLAFLDRCAELELRLGTLEGLHHLKAQRVQEQYLARRCAAFDLET